MAHSFTIFLIYCECNNNDILSISLELSLSETVSLPGIISSMKY